MGLDREPVSFGLNRYFHLHMMILAMEIEDSINDKVSVNDLVECALDSVGAKSDDPGIGHCLGHRCASSDRGLSYHSRQSLHRSQ